jgi:hypothetical protein
MTVSRKRGSRADFASVTPLVPAGPSLDEALQLYVGAMGFRLQWRAVGMAGIERDGVAFNLMQSDDRHWADNSSFSIGVHDLPALHAEYADVPARIGPLEEKAWGRVEFHMVLPSGVCLQFYEAEEPPIGSTRARSTD